MKCITIHAPKNRLAVSNDPEGGFQFVSVIGNLYGKTIQYNKNNFIHKIPG